MYIMILSFFCDVSVVCITPWWPNMNSPKVIMYDKNSGPQWQQTWPWSKYKVKVTAWNQLKGFVAKIMYAKYQCSFINTSEDINQVKVFATDWGKDR